MFGQLCLWNDRLSWGNDRGFFGFAWWTGDGLCYRVHDWFVGFFRFGCLGDDSWPVSDLLPQGQPMASKLQKYVIQALATEVLDLHQLIVCLLNEIANETDIGRSQTPRRS